MKINPTLLGFIHKELVQTLRDPRMRVLLFIAPLIQLTIFGLAITNDVKNIRLGYSGKPNDTILYEFYRDAIASEWFVPAKVTTSDPYQMIQSNEADAVIVAPPEGVMTSAERGNGRIQLLVNASNVLRAQSVENYGHAILNRIIPRYFPPSQAAKISFDMRILYNPTLRSAVYMVPGVISLIICIITVNMTSMSLSKEKETGTFEVLLAAPLNINEIIFGKAIPYVILGFCNVPLILAVAVFAFDVPIRGPLWMLALASFIFICTTVSIGIMISTISKTQQQSMMAGILFLFPAVQLSGLTFPIDNMPNWIKFIAYINPLTYYLQLLRTIMLKGGDAYVFITHTGALLVMLSIIAFISFKRFKMTLG